MGPKEYFLNSILTGILILRLSALYGRYPMVKVVLFLFLGLSIVSGIVVVTLTVPKLTG